MGSGITKNIKIYFNRKQNAIVFSARLDCQCDGNKLKLKKFGSVKARPKNN